MIGERGGPLRDGGMYLLVVGLLAKSIPPNRAPGVFAPLCVPVQRDILPFPLRAVECSGLGGLPASSTLMEANQLSATVLSGHEPVWLIERRNPSRVQAAVQPLEVCSAPRSVSKTGLRRSVVMSQARLPHPHQGRTAAPEVQALDVG